MPPQKNVRIVFLSKKPILIVVSTEKSKKLTQTFWGCLRLLHLKCHHSDGMHRTHSFIASDRSTVSSKLYGLESILSLCGTRAWILGEHHQGNCKRDCLLCRHMHKAAFTSRELKYIGVLNTCKPKRTFTSHELNSRPQLLCRRCGGHVEVLNVPTLKYRRYRGDMIEVN